MSQKYSSHVLNHGEDTRTLKAEVPSGGSDNFSLDTVGNWSNEILSFEDFRVFGVNKSNNGEFYHADKYDNDILFMKVSINTHVDHEPDDLSNHENKTYDEKTFLKKGLTGLWRKVIFGLVGFNLDVTALAISVVVKIDGMYLAQFYLTKTKICWNKWSVVVVHESLCFHLCDLVVDSIDSALCTTISQYFFVLGQVFEDFHVMVVIGASVSERCNQVDDRSPLLFWVNVSFSSLCCKKYLVVLFHIFNIGLQYINWCDRTLAFICKTVPTAWY